VAQGKAMSEAIRQARITLNVKSLPGKLGICPTRAEACCYGPVFEILKKMLNLGQF
jgi:hypothetical protein